MTEHPTPASPAAAPADAAPEQMQVRLAKLDRMRAAGTDPYPVGYPRTDTIARGP